MGTLSRSEARKVLNELNANLRHTDGSSKSGVLRLMYASEGSTNESRSLSFERKSWYQISRWGKDSSERTKQALQSIIERAELPPAAAQALDTYFSTHTRISARSLAGLLNKYVPLVDEPIAGEVTAATVNKEMERAQLQLGKTPLDSFLLDLPSKDGSSRKYRVAQQLIKDVEKRGHLQLRDGALEVCSINPGRSPEAKKWQAIGQFLDSIDTTAYEGNQEKLGNLCFNLSSMVGQYIQSDFMAELDKTAREAAIRFRPDLPPT